MADEFSLGKYPQSSLLVVYSERHQILLDPEYQRISGIWTRETRQHLLDSLLNGFDVPKLYFHEFVPPKRKDGKNYRYAIIDGKQRLQTIWDFIDGKLQLDERFRYLKDQSVNAEGLDYAELARRYPHLKNRFDATGLDIVTIRTDDLELIEDMFSRLNEAVPLNAAEKRNALGGPLPRAITGLVKHPFFTKNVPFPDNRYRHRDLAAKFLYLEYKDKIANTKKSDLDNFVKEFKKWRKERDSCASKTVISGLLSRVTATLIRMNSVFGMSDSLLRQVGMITMYYHLFRNVTGGHVDSVSRDMLAQFETRRVANRRVVEQSGEAGSDVDTQLLEFDKHSQTPNDAYAIRERLAILLKFLQRMAKVKYDDRICRRPD